MHLEPPAASARECGKAAAVTERHVPAVRGKSLSFDSTGGFQRYGKVPQKSVPVLVIHRTLRIFTRDTLAREN